MKKRWLNLVLSLFLTVSTCLMAGCNSTNSEKTVLLENPSDTMEQETKEEEHKSKDTEEMVIAVNVDQTTSSLPFESVWMNRSKFWGGLIFQGLLIADENMNNLQLDLCEDYAISPDGLSYVFTLKNNLYWHDGERLTLEDVVWSIETFLKVQETNGFISKGLQGIEGVDKFISGEMNHISGLETEDNNLVIRICQQDNSFLASLAQLAILPKHCLDSLPPEEISGSSFWQMPVGSGPYKIVTNKDGKDALLVYNELYSGKKPKIERIRYKVLENPETDPFDFTITSDPKTVAAFEKNPDYEVIQSHNLYYRYLFFNLDARTGENQGLLQDKKIRQALLYGLDRKSIINNLYHGMALNMTSGVPTYDSWYLQEDSEIDEYRPTKAKEMLEEAGFDFNKTLVLTRYSTDALSAKLLEEIAQCWNSLGIKTEIVEIKSNATELLFVKGDWYDVALKNLSSVDYTEWYYEYSSGNQLWSDVWKQHDEYDELVDAIQNAEWASEKNTSYQKIQQLEKDLVFKIPLALVPQYVIYNKKNLYIPDITFPNLWYYYNLSLPQWELLKEPE